MTVYFGAPTDLLNMATTHCKISLKAKEIATPIGQMLAVADATALYLLSFIDSTTLSTQLSQLQQLTKSAITTGRCQTLVLITTELNAYFAGCLQTFTCPTKILGTGWQQLAWQELMRVPYGQTKSYGEQAKAVGKPTAYRAVANANSKNKLAIIVPCHRIINSNGCIGGYAGGITRKQWLLQHEQQRR